MLRDRFGIIGNDKQLVEFFLSNMGRAPGDTRKVPSIIGNVFVKKICQEVVISYI
jgi:hypothetical protein